MDYPRAYGDYMLLEHLGAGGMSTVELARRTVGDNDYVRFAVIKRVLARRAEQEESSRMFLDEARINSELHHENIAGIYDFGFREDEFYLVMEYVPGMDLRQVQRALFRRQLNLPLRVTFTVIDKVLAGLEYAHGAVDTLGRPMLVVHRDINPRNVMLSTRGDVKIIDFGLAKAEHRVEETVGDVVKGKFSYMAPEQIEAHDVDGRTDLFAVGLMLQELVNGRQNFKDLTHIQIVHRILAGRMGELVVPTDFGFPERLHAIRDRALALDPDERFATAADFRRDLGTVAHLAGGLCTRAEMSEFMRHVDAGRISAISDRLVTYQNSQVSRVLPPPAPVVSQSEEPPSGGALFAERPTGTKKTRVVALMALAAGLAGAGVLALNQLGTDDRVPMTDATPDVTPDVTPAPVQAAPAAPEPESVVAPPPAKKATPTRKAASPKAVAPEPEPEREVVPEPEPEPEPEVVPEPEPEVVPEPEPEVLAEGYLYVSSRPSNLEVRVDGSPIGRTPIKLYKLSVGPHLVVVIDAATGSESAQDVNIAEGNPVRVIASLE
jgi:serine/threonine protein kinase